MAIIGVDRTGQVSTSGCPNAVTAGMFVRYLRYTIQSRTLRLAATAKCDSALAALLS